MRHDRLEPGGRGIGPLRRLDARLKLVATLAFVVAVVSTPIGAWRPLAVAALVLAFLCGLGGASPGVLARRWLAMAPLILMFAALIAPSHPKADTYGPWFVGGTIVAKNALALSAVLLLGEVTPIRDLLVALGRLRVPPTLVATLHLMARYLVVLVDQLGRMARARRCRSFRRGRVAEWPLGASVIAALMLRAFERGERVHSAMLARGWDGTIRSLDGPDPDSAS